MKKNYFLTILFILGSLSSFAQWGHRYATEQVNQNINVETGTNFTVSVEWGEGDWTNSEFGYGTTTDGTGWTWVSLPWFEDGDGSNKRCKTDITINSSNVYYYAYRFEKDGATTYQLGDESWSANTAVLSAVSTITAFSTKTWTGTTDTDWNTATNWSPTGVPNSVDNVIIPVLSNQPVVSGAVTVNQATLASGASLIANSTFTGTINYNVNVTDDNWHLISSPVVGQVYGDTWANDNIVADGNGTNRGISTYQNGAPNATTGPWVYMQDGTNSTFDSGVGYSLKRTSSGTYAFTGTFPNGPITPAISTNTNDWNLIGNPYPSNLNIATFITENSTTNDFIADGFDAIYVWNPTEGGTGAYNELTTGFIQPGQAFFIKSKVDGAANITEAMQSHTTGTFYKNTDTSINLLLSNGKSTKRTKINYLGGKSTSLDAGFDIGMFDGVDSDLRIYTHLIENNEGIAFARQALPNTDLESMVIPVGVKVEAGKEITFSAEALNLPSEIKVYLEDRTTNTFTRLDEANSEYKITLSEALNGTGRFYLHTAQKALSLNTNTILENVSIYKADASTLRIVGLQEGNATIKLFNLLGKQMMNSTFKTNGVQNISLPQLATGVYFVQVTTDAGKLNKKIILE